MARAQLWTTACLEKRQKKYYFPVKFHVLVYENFVYLCEETVLQIIIVARSSECVGQRMPQTSSPAVHAIRWSRSRRRCKYRRAEFCTLRLVALCFFIKH